jgi:hypothetical protein
VLDRYAAQDARCAASYGKGSSGSETTTSLIGAEVCHLSR